ncbi:hypothetical protein G7068_03955 [Leucobacter viscericola]|uniref:Peptidoglycan binding domain-containing protein n=1 Tax=Leucobacter viscericola TaxID=2714935 RepID=A0A6G7XDD9_9MICO|nr:hypothetical protein [Leucobacter viscericola]QIK62459.1 hypothetical protein G7068_03955 [Leucobacter viscericola]
MAALRRNRKDRGSSAEGPPASETNIETEDVETAVLVESVVTAETEADADAEPVKKKRGWKGARLVALIAGVAVVSMLIGVGVMQFIVSPADAASRTKAPDPGPVTAPIEKRQIENTVVIRGQVSYADSVQVAIDSPGGSERAVITGRVPEVGAILNTGNLALEVAGRPVIVLPGELPAYRTLSIGMRGPDVVQLKAALTAMGFGVGDTSSDVYDGDTAAAVGALYEQVGYSAPNGGDEAQKALRVAERGVRDAQLSLAQAQAQLSNAIDIAQPNTNAEQAAVNAANDALGDAQSTLVTAQEAVMPTLPSSEVLFLTGLPRRVDDVSVNRGDVLSGSPMSVSGATLTISGTVSQQDAELLTDGAKAFFSAPNGDELTATVKKIQAPKSGGKSGDSGGSKGSEGQSSGSGGSGSGGNSQDSSRYTVTMAPSELSSEEIEALRDTNVRVKIPVASTKGEVMAVPLAALSAGSGGEDRIELMIDPKSGPDAVTENVVVKVGLAADGFVEITSDDPRVKKGAKVVVGR